MTYADMKDVLYTISTGGLICGFPLLVLGWMFLDGWTASRSVAVKDIGGSSTKADGDCDKSKAQKQSDWFASALSSAGLAFAKVRGSALGLFRTFIAMAWVLSAGSRIVAYALILLPWFMPIVWAYFRSPRVVKGLRFGPHARNYLDIYLPNELLDCAVGEARPKASVPVVVAAMGGAWTIGHRAWNAQVGFRLADAGVMVVAVDYRNFPFALVGDMVQDIDEALKWVFANIANFGGDPGNVALMGQSAGAHLQALLLVSKALAAAREETLRGTDTSVPTAPAIWSPCDLKGWAGVSGVYDMLALEKHLQTWGIAGCLPIVVEDGDLTQHSPVHRLRELQDTRRLPQAVRLFHGAADATVPPAQTASFAEELEAVGISTHTEIRKGVTHSEPVVEDPFRGGDLQAQLVIPFFGPEFVQRLAQLPPPRPQPPKWVVGLAQLLMPF